MRALHLLLCLGILCLTFSCSDEAEEIIVPAETDIYAINGFVQKGPFLIGSEITVRELKKNLAMTGKNFSSQITDASGAFSFQGLELIYDIVECSGNGFYFNEVLGEKSAAPIQLTSYASLSEDLPVYVNVLTHLEKPRVKVLMDGGASYQDAKAQAQSEVVRVFEIADAPNGLSERLNVFGGGLDDAKLLAMSIILQGRRTEAALSELLARMQVDLAQDGRLDDPELGSALINDVKFLDLVPIRANIEDRALELGLTNSIPNFERYINDFIQNTDFAFSLAFDFPQTGKNGINLLALQDQDTITFGTDYSLAANLNENDELKVRLSSAGVNWGYNTSSNIGWSISNFKSASTFEENSQEFISIAGGQAIDLSVQFFDQVDGTVQLELFENSDVQPTQVKTLVFNGSFQPYAFPAAGDFGNNLLFESGLVVADTGSYSIVVEINTLQDFNQEMPVELVVESGTIEIGSETTNRGWAIDNTEGLTTLSAGQSIFLTTINAPEFGLVKADLSVLLLVGGGKLSLRYLSEDLKEERLTEVEW